MNDAARIVRCLQACLRANLDADLVALRAEREQLALAVAEADEQRFLAEAAGCSWRDVDRRRKAARAAERELLKC